MKTVFVVMEVGMRSRQEGWISSVFETYEDAHAAWLVRKREFAKMLAELQVDTRIASILVERYENLK